MPDFLVNLINLAFSTLSPTCYDMPSLSYGYVKWFNLLLVFTEESPTSPSP